MSQVEMPDLGLHNNMTCKMTKKVSSTPAELHLDQTSKKFTILRCPNSDANFFFTFCIRVFQDFLVRTSSKTVKKRLSEEYSVFKPLITEIFHSPWHFFLEKQLIAIFTDNYGTFQFGFQNIPKNL